MELNRLEMDFDLDQYDRVINSQFDISTVGDSTMQAELQIKSTPSSAISSSTAYVDSFSDRKRQIPWSDL